MNIANRLDNVNIVRSENCFNLIRLLASLQVFFGHAVQHFEIEVPSLLHELWWSFRGVPVFFVLSGFYYGIL